MTSQIDSRGPQFTAAVTVVVLAAVLVTAPSAFATALLGAQAVLFAVGAALGVQKTPHAWVFRSFVRPRLTNTPEWEDPAPPRFAQAVGLAFALVGFVGFAAGATVVGLVATGFALTAAVLNAVFKFCLGCELYLLLRRATTRPAGVEARAQRASKPPTPEHAPIGG
ncbi:MAG: DUF4395 domain-containing protein [Nocardioides sp.]|nr:DUF4395 domain-containing protein [Nocardioides sp.]